MFVPTMGGLHQGHAALVRRAAAQEASVLVSVFVNPLQFGPSEDFERYPRTLEADRCLAEEAGAAALWAPDSQTMYPNGAEEAWRLQVPASLQATLCGRGRPGHFDGVATVVARLLALVRPEAMVLGEKDWQQLVILRRLVHDLGLNVRISGVATVREADGLALSSRNRYLTADQRGMAAALPRVLATASASTSAAGVRDQLLQAGLEVEYVERVDPESLQPCGPETTISLLAAAVRCGSTRLIDHVFVMTRQPLVAIDGLSLIHISEPTRPY